MFVSTKLYPCFKFFTSNSLLRFFRMKFRKKGSLRLKLSRNISRVTSLKSVLNINIEGTRARRKFRHEDTRARQHRRHEGTPEIWARWHEGTRARRHRRHEGTQKIWARGNANIDGTRARQKFGHEGTSKIWARGHGNIEGTRARRARRARHLTDSA